MGQEHGLRALQVRVAGEVDLVAGFGRAGEQHLLQGVRTAGDVAALAAK